MRRWGWVLAVPAMFAGTACYEYHDARIDEVRPSASVHVVLSSEASTALAAAIGPNATSIDGRVVSVDGRTIRLAATQIARVVGPEEFLRDEPIDVPAAGALSISLRSVDRLRSVLAVGAILAAAVTAHRFADQPGVISVRGAPASGTK